MIQSYELAILDLALMSLQGAIRRSAARLLEGPGELDVTTIRRVEYLMRIALDLAGVGHGVPVVEFHDIPPVADPGAPPGENRSGGAPGRSRAAPAVAERRDLIGTGVAN